MNAESTPAPKAKEMDLLHRSSEKHVRSVEGDSPSDADNHGEELAAVDGSESSPNADPTVGFSSQRSVTEAVTKPPVSKELYMGEEVEGDLEVIEKLCNPPVDEMENNGDDITPVIRFDPETYRLLCKPWRGALLIKLLGKSVNFRVLKQKTQELWKLHRGYEIIDLADDFNVARFYSREDYFHVLEGGPWVVFRHYLTVSKWRPNFSPPRETSFFTAVWVRFPDFPMEHLDEKFLSKLGNVVGKTVKVDYKTATTPARVFVQVDLAKPLVTAVDDVHGRSRVEYESLHLICLNCGRYGHGTAGCQKKKVIKEKEAVNTAEKEARYGPWMLAPKNGRRRRRRRRKSSEVSQNIESLRKRIQDLPCPSQEIEAEAKLLTSRSYSK